MAGLLDGYGIDPLGMGLLGAGGALLTPRQQGGGIGAALQAFPQGMMQGQEMQRRLQAQAQAQQYQQQRMGMEQRRFGMDEQKFSLELKEYEARQTAAAREQQFMDDFVAYAAQKDPEIALLARVDRKAAVERAFPKPEWRTWFNERGQQTQGYAAPGQAPTQVGGVERKLQGVNLGGSYQLVDPLEQTGPLKMTQSPDSLASNAVSIRNENMRDARSRELAAATREAAAGGRIPSGYRANPDGSLSFIPGGPADPATKADKAPTEAQTKDNLFATRADAADKIVVSLGSKPSVAGVSVKQSLAGLPLIGGSLGAGANSALSPESQQYEQAKRDFINAVLRKESGAVIGKDEFDSADKQYFPQPFDSAEVKQQKAENRRRAVEGIGAGAGPLGKGIGLPAAGPAANNDPLGLRR